MQVSNGIADHYLRRICLSIRTSHLIIGRFVDLEDQAVGLGTHAGEDSLPNIPVRVHTHSALRSKVPISA